MTNRDVALLAYRLLGLWLVASALVGLASVPYVWETVHEEIRRLAIVAMFLPSVVMFVVGAAVWLNAEWLSTLTFPVGSSDALGVDRLRGEAVLATAFTIIGVIFVAEAIPALVNSAALLVQSYTSTNSVLGRDQEQQRLLWSASAMANTAAGVSRLLIGLVFLAGPRRLSAAIATIRTDLRGTLEEGTDGDRPSPGPMN